MALAASRAAAFIVSSGFGGHQVTLELKDLTTGVKYFLYFSSCTALRTCGPVRTCYKEHGGMSAGTGNDAKAATEDPVLRCCMKLLDSRSLADVTAALPALKQMHQV
jgi:predicted RNA-binding protein with PUA-like domain